MASILQQYLKTGVSFLLLIGFTSALIGPPTQTGFLGRSLSVDCTYDQSYLKHFKYWCQGANWNNCDTVVKTRGTEAEVKADRTSIKDDQARLQFTVRMENLTEQDAGTYWCAIERTGKDPGSPVVITVLPEPTTTAAVTTEHFSTATVISTASPTQGITDMILLPIVFLVLVVILVGALLLMWKIRKQKAAKAREDIVLSTAPRQTDGNTSSATGKPKLQHHHKTTTPCSDQATKYAEVEYASVIARSHASPPQLPTNTEEVSYTTLRFPDLNENATYANLR